MRVIGKQPADRDWRPPVASPNSAYQRLQRSADAQGRIVVFRFDTEGDDPCLSTKIRSNNGDTISVDSLELTIVGINGRPAVSRHHPLSRLGYAKPDLTPRHFLMLCLASSRKNRPESPLLTRGDLAGLPYWTSRIPIASHDAKHAFNAEVDDYAHCAREHRTTNSADVPIEWPPPSCHKVVECEFSPSTEFWLRVGLTKKKVRGLIAGHISNRRSDWGEIDPSEEGKLIDYILTCFDRHVRTLEDRKVSREDLPKRTPILVGLLVHMVLRRIMQDPIAKAMSTIAKYSSSSVRSVCCSLASEDEPSTPWPRRFALAYIAGCDYCRPRNPCVSRVWDEEPAVAVELFRAYSLKLSPPASRLFSHPTATLWHPFMEFVGALANLLKEQFVVEAMGETKHARSE
jgi:hypothetical protein